MAVPRFKRLIGTLCWTPARDFFVVTDQGEHWQLDLPWLMTDHADRHLATRIYVEGLRSGRRTVYVTILLPAPPQGGWAERLVLFLERKFGI